MDYDYTKQTIIMREESKILMDDRASRIGTPLFNFEMFVWALWLRFFLGRANNRGRETKSNY
jgi:hypothetical protein